MAIIIAQRTHKYKQSKTTIPRLKQENLKSVELKKSRYENPAIPESFCKYEILPLKILCHQAVEFQAK